MTNAGIPTVSVSTEQLPLLRRWLVDQVAQGQHLAPDGVPPEELLQQLLDEAYERSRANLPETLRKQLYHDVMNDLVGYGPIQPLLDDPSVTEVMVNGHKQVYIEREGKLLKTNITFSNDQAVMNLIERIVLPLGRRVDEETPTVDARLPDGSRVNAVIPPVSIDGPSLTIRKFSRERMRVDDLIRLNSITAHMAEFLRACVVARLNIIISGGTGSGKTTLLNILSEAIPEQERIVTIEDAAELQLHQEHVVRLEAKPPNINGAGEITIRHLVRNALRMRPDRIVVGEVRGGEALDMLQAMNTGHDGSLTTVHANAPRDATSRIETLVLLSGFDLPVSVAREQIASAIDVIVQQARLRDGSRKVVSITEVAGMEGNTIVLSEIFKFEEVGIDQGGNVLGELKPTGIRPMFDRQLETAGFKLAPEVFGANLDELRSPGRRKG